METSWKKLRFVVEQQWNPSFLLGICLFRILSKSAIIWNLPIYRGFQKLQNSLLVNFSPKTWLKSKIIDAIANLTFEFQFVSSGSGFRNWHKVAKFLNVKSEVFNIFTQVSSVFFLLFSFLETLLAKVY